LFEEQIEHESLDIHTLLEEWDAVSPEADSYLPDMDDYNLGPRMYLEYLEEAKKVLSIPVIASLNGSSPGGWIRYARQMEDAGADALELNVYYVAADPAMPSSEVEERYLRLVREIRQAVSIPLAVKVGPYFSAMANMAVRLAEAGADGLVLFNRFLQPDIDLDELAVVPTLHLSTPQEIRLVLRWIAILRGRVAVSLAATTGVHTWEDALKTLLVGADVAMMASALLHHGPSHLVSVLDGLRGWMEERGYESVEQLKGSMSQVACPNPAEFERSNYVQALVDYSSRYL